MLTFKTSKLQKQNETNLSTETESSLWPQGRRGEGRTEQMNVKKENREGKRTEKDEGCVQKFEGQ